MIKILYIVTAILILLSCNNRNEYHTKQKVLMKYDTVNVSIKFSDSLISKGLPLTYYDKESNIQSFNYDLSKREFLLVYKFVSEFLCVNSKLWSLTIYYNRHLKDNDLISFKDISALQLYTIKPNGKLYHNFYLKKDNSFYELSDFDCETNGIYYNSVRYFLQNEIHNTDTIRSSLINFYNSDLLKNDSEFKNVNKKSKDFLIYKIRKYGKKRFLNLKS